MNVKKDDIISAFKKAKVPLIRSLSGGVLTAIVPNGGVWVELTPDESGVTAVKVLFPAKAAETFQALFIAMWEGVLPGVPWRAKIDECIQCAMDGKPFAETNDGIEIKLRHNRTESELVAHFTPKTVS